MANPHFIILGNEKGGTGKSTMAMHLIVHLLQQDKTVGVIDLDSRQRSLTRYLESRESFSNEHGLNLQMPEFTVVNRSAHDSVRAMEDQERAWLEEAIKKMGAQFIVIDCPGNDTWLSRIAHTYADTLLTPINDSFVDLDLIGQLTPDGSKVIKLSYYSELVWDCRKARNMNDRESTDWVITRNRLASLSSRNNRRVERALESLKEKIKFRIVPGLSERVIYRELFLKGLTMMDFGKVEQIGKMQLSHVTARQEVRQLVESLNLPMD